MAAFVLDIVHRRQQVFQWFIDWLINFMICLIDWLKIVCVVVSDVPEARRAEDGVWGVPRQANRRIPGGQDRAGEGQTDVKLLVES